MSMCFSVHNFQLWCVHASGAVCGLGGGVSTSLQASAPSAISMRLLAFLSQDAAQKRSCCLSDF